MTKPLSLITLALLILLPFSYVSAQHADLGSGVLKDQVWWIDWAGMNIINGASKTVTTNDGLTLKITILNLNGRAPAPTVMNSWSGAVLHLLYDFSDPNIKPALYDNNATGICKFTVTVSASRNGSPVPFYLITADAEASAFGETTTLKTNGSAWQTMTLFRNSSQTDDPLGGCGTQTATITNTYDGFPQEGQNPVITTLSPLAGSLAVDVTLDHGTTTGGMAVAFGIMQAEDRGDLPAGYGFAQHQINYAISNPCGYLPPDMPALNQDTKLYIGAVPPDADPIQYTDDNAIGVDEEGISSFPAYDGSGSYSLTFPVVNTTGKDAWLSCWFDYDRNGTFSSAESVLINVPDNATSATATWTDMPQCIQESNMNFAFRLRITSDRTAAQSAAGFAADGEVEDYSVPQSVLIPPVSAGTGATICQGQSAQLSGTSTAGYSWTPVTGLSNANIANPIATPASTTTYTLNSTNFSGCPGQSSVTVTVNPQATVSVRTDTTICSSSSVRLTAQATNASIFQWQPSTGLSDPGIQSPVASPSANTVYMLTVNNSAGCGASASVAIGVKPSPTLSASNDTLICQGTSVTLNASGTQTYSWTSTGVLFHASGPAVTVAPRISTTYYVQGTAANGCAAMDSVVVAVHAIPVFSVSPQAAAICPNDTLRMTASGGDQYTWTLSAGAAPDTVPSVLVSPDANSDYQVRIVDNICRMSATLDVPVHIKPVPSLSVTSSNDIDCTLGESTLNATGALDWLWLNDSSLSNPFSPDIVVRPTKSTVYYVKGTGANGCSNIDSVRVGVDFTADLSKYPVPSAFTPNNDGNNDCFGLKYWGRINHLQLEIFNRQGLRVFFTGDPQQCWDGTLNGTPQPAGAYVYQIRAATACGTAYRTGIVILVR
ncbi:MAG: gliding motility-associated C-terminal domain-containing protein [Bacteroidetes bacterium]|nr:gliding motility-associated C-terminal domain-containing protein [Bacteroidota bacterium]